MADSGDLPRTNRQRQAGLKLALLQEVLVLAFPDRLEAAVRRCGNPVLVGLDPRAESLPQGFLAAGEEKSPAAVGRGLWRVLPRGDRRGGPAGAGRQAAGGVLRAARPGRHGRAWPR